MIRKITGIAGIVALISGCTSVDIKPLSAEVDGLLDKAVAAGGSSFREPEDYGFMYGRSFRDLDGHIWEIMWMGPAAV